MWRKLALEEALNDCAVIRTTFETLEYFPDDELMRLEIWEIADEARGKLAAKYRSKLDADWSSVEIGILREFRRHLIEVMRHGFPGRPANSMMRLNAFVDDERFFYVFRDGLTPKLATELSPDVFMQRVFSDLLGAVEDDESCISRSNFDLLVYQKYLAVMFCFYMADNSILHTDR